MSKNYDTGSAVIDGVRFANLIKKTYSRSSLTRDAKDTIAQYPVIFSADIPTEDATVIAKAFEAQYAALLVSVISASPDYDRSRYENPAEYLKNFFDNRSVPAVLNVLESQLPEDVFSEDLTLESATIYHDIDRLIPTRIATECWEDTDSAFNTATLNHRYKPESMTQRAMEGVVNQLRALHTPAMEASGDDILNSFGARGSRLNSDDVGTPTKADRVERTTERGVYQTDDKGQIIIDPKTKKPIRMDRIRENRVLRAPAETARQGFNTYNDKLGSMAPTMVNVQLTSHHGNAPVITHNIVLGVKAMVRSVPQDLMISNLAEGISETRGVLFKFIKWTKGEYRFVSDFILGIDNAKSDAASNKDMKHWLKTLQRRKRSDAINKITSGMAMPPMTTIVTTSYEVARVKEMTGLDLNDELNAAKLIAKHYLLGFAIYDSETGRIRSIFDGDASFSINTISGLKTKQQKDQDLVQYAQFVRAAGRM